ncbi:AraC-type DNA-binding protein [Massilia sp. PDC64]|nr:helix-turn-helix domain-containing protein [Massilia sp. PDC64]SDD06049.1 AraC-type DNA-binding protein [Massilia sp. PDC64]
MQDFYKQALVALILVLAADALIAWFCIQRSYPSASLVPRERSGVRWRPAVTTDAILGGTSTIRIVEPGRQSFRFDFRITSAATYPYVGAELVLEDGQGNAAPADLSKYTTVTFLARCAPANSLVFSLSTFDPGISTPGMFHTYPSPLTYFSCSERGTPVSLDLTRLTIPPWWFQAAKIDPSRQSYDLGKVGRFVFGISPKSPREVDSRVEIGEFTLHGRDDRYLVALAVILATGWGAFAAWFLRAHSRALVAGLDAQLKNDRRFFAYRQLTLEPFKDKEKAAILQYIGTHYTDPELDMASVTARIGADREKINEILKTELGMTFTGYVNQLRLTAAARLLTDKADMPIADIAFSVGYANVSYFNKLFKEEYGCTPKAFRSHGNR